MRRRILALVTGTALLAVTLLAVPLGVAVGRNYERDERLELQRAALTAAARARGDELATGRLGVADPEISVTVYDRSGHRRSGTGPVAAPDGVRIALRGGSDVTSAGGRLAVTEPITDRGRVASAVLLTTDLGAARSRTRNAWLVLAAMCAGAVLVAAAGALLVTRRLARPLERLAGVARRVGDGELTARAGRSGIGEVDVLASTLNATVERLGETLVRERSLSGEVSHQLRTPLAGLRLALDAGDVERAAVAADRLESTIDEIIALARGRADDARAAPDPDVVLRTLEERWHGLFAAAGRPLRVESRTDPDTRLGISVSAAAQIVDVLVDNALRHGSGAVTVRVRPAGESLVAIDVVDEGPRLLTPPNVLFLGAERPDPPGHGIGLRFARRLAEAEGGRLGLSETLPPTFTLTVARQVMVR